MVAHRHQGARSDLIGQPPSEAADPAGACAAHDEFSFENFDLDLRLNGSRQSRALGQRCGAIERRRKNLLRVAPARTARRAAPTLRR